jgi:hypothetical protein
MFIFSWHFSAESESHWMSSSRHIKSRLIFKIIKHLLSKSLYADLDLTRNLRKEEGSAFYLSKIYIAFVAVFISFSPSFCFSSNYLCFINEQGMFWWAVMKDVIMQCTGLSYTLHAFIRQTNTTICKKIYVQTLQNHARCPQGIPCGNEVSDTFNHIRMGVFMKNMRKCSKEISHDLGCRSAIW